MSCFIFVADRYGECLDIARDVTFTETNCRPTGLKCTQGLSCKSGASNLNFDTGQTIANMVTAKLGAGGGGLSGPPLHAIALRCVADVARALPGVPIIGTGGVSRGSEAVAMLLAGATAVGVGTATFAEPRATLRIRDELSTWCRHNSVRRSADLTGGLRWPT